jgi:hypothetical protein
VAARLCVHEAVDYLVGGSFTTGGNNYSRGILTAGPFRQFRGVTRTFRESNFEVNSV